MKSVCKYCGQNKLINWGGRRRFCKSCDRSFRVPKAGRIPSRGRDMYLLDRSTYRRIGDKKKYSHVAIIKRVQKEIAPIVTPVDWLKKIYIKLPVFLLLMPNMPPLKAKTIVNIWPSILQSV